MTRSIAFTTGAFAVLAALAGCGSPPELERMRAGTQAPAMTKGDDTTTVGSPESEPDPVLCNEQTAAYEPQRTASNIVFALDRSGSMHARLPNGGTRWTATRDALFSLVDSLRQSKTRMSVMQFPQGDPTVNSCCAIDANNEVTCDCSSYPAPTKRCDPATYSAPSPMELDEAGVSSIKQTVNASNQAFYWGTPLAAAELAAIKIQKASPNDGIKSVVLLTDGAPTSCETSTNASANDASFVINAAKSGMANGDSIRTFVIGVVDGTTAAPPDILSKVAEAGGTGRFYSVDASQLQKDLGEALAKIERAATDCTFDLPDAQEGNDPEMVNVLASGPSGTVTVARDRAQKSGWDYVQNDVKRIKLYGDACNDIASGEVTKVKVVFGCKTMQ